MREFHACRSFLRILGLAWTILLGAVTAVAAQTRPESSSPPVRLPGVVYPGDAAAKSPDPKLKPTGQRTPSSPTERRSRASHTRARAPRWSCCPEGPLAHDLSARRPV